MGRSDIRKITSDVISDRYDTLSGGQYLDKYDDKFSASLIQRYRQSIDIVISSVFQDLPLTNGLNFIVVESSQFNMAESSPD